MARPSELGVPRDVILNCKVSPGEDKQLQELVRRSGLSKSELIRRALHIIFRKAVDTQTKAEKRVKEMVKAGKFSISSVSAICKVYEEELERELNKMVYDEVVKNKDKNLEH